MCLFFFPFSCVSWICGLVSIMLILKNSWLLFFIYFLCPFLSLFSIWDSNYMCVIHVCFSLFLSLCMSVLIISFDIFSSPLIL